MCFRSSFQIPVCKLIHLRLVEGQGYERLMNRRYFVRGLSALSAIPFLRVSAATLSGPALNSEVSIENFRLPARAWV